MKERLAHLDELRAQASAGGGEKAIERQHEKGKLTARERLDILLDDGSFVEMDAFVRPATVRYGGQKDTLGDGLVAGHGRVEGRHVFVYSQDFTVMGGSLGERHAEKILKVAKLARKTGAPVIAIQDSGGARIQEGVFSLGGYAEIFRANTLTSGVVPQIAVVLGPCAGGAVYSPGLMDFVFMVESNSHMFLTGPDVIKTVLHEEVTFDELGGASVHAEKSGVAHFVHENEVACLKGVRDLLAYLPANNLEPSPVVEEAQDDPERREQELNEIVPDDPNKPYDIKGVVEAVVDKGTFLEVHEGWAQNLVVGFARMDGRVVGVVANQPAVLAGVLEVNACVKGARFIRFCDAFNIPILSFVDVPGFLPGSDQEHQGIIRHGAKLLHAYAEATVPLLTTVTRKAYGGAYCVMAPKQLGADLNLAWPSAQFAVMGAEGAVNILYRRELAEAKKPDALRKKLVQTYEEDVQNPYVAAERGYVDDVIAPMDTRPRLVAALRLLANKRERLPGRKHGNIPL